MSFTCQSTPFHCRPYPIPGAHKRIFEEELDRLVDIKVLEPTGPCECLSPNFIIPKKDNRVRWASDSRRLDSMIRRKFYTYTLPQTRNSFENEMGIRISPILMSQCNITRLNLMSHPETSVPFACLLATTKPTSRYPTVAWHCQKNRGRSILTIGWSWRLHWWCWHYSNSWKEPLASVSKVLHILQNNNFTSNPLKCEWAVTETIGWDIGLFPLVLYRVRPTTTIKELRSIRRVPLWHFPTMILLACFSNNTIGKTAHPVD